MSSGRELQNTLRRRAAAGTTFHLPCDARVCAAVRIAYASLVLVHLATLYPTLTSGSPTRACCRWKASPSRQPLLHRGHWQRPAGNPTCDCSRSWNWSPKPRPRCISAGGLPYSTPCVCWLVCCRAKARLLFLWIVSFQVRNNLINDGEDCLMRLLGFFMIWLPSGRCWSVNALLRRWWQSGSTLHAPHSALASDCFVPGWSLRLFQIEMAAMLFSSGLIKLGGEPWLNGTALYYVSRLDDLFGRFPVPAWLFDTPWIVAVVTWSVVAAEVLIPLLIWFRETRLPCLLVLLVFHLANEWTMNLFLFHWLMLCGWISFVSPEDFRWLRCGVSSSPADRGPG